MSIYLMFNFNNIEKSFKNRANENLYKCIESFPLQKHSKRNKLTYFLTFNIFSI